MSRDWWRWCAGPMPVVFEQPLHSGGGARANCDGVATAGLGAIERAVCLRDQRFCIDLSLLAAQTHRDADADGHAKLSPTARYRHRRGSHIAA